MQADDRCALARFANEALDASRANRRPVLRCCSMTSAPLTSEDPTMTSWDRLAPFYDLQLPLERSALRAAVRLASPSSQERVLDLATGTGGFLRHLATLQPAPLEAVGIDVSGKMLERVPPLPKGWRLNRAPAQHVPFPDASFEVVAAAFLLHLLDPPSRHEVLLEARRLLRPGGRLVVVTSAPPRSAALRLLAAPLLALARRSAGALAGLRPLDPAPDLERAGFAIRANRWTGRGFPAFVVLATPVAHRSDSSLTEPGGGSR